MPVTTTKISVFVSSPSDVREVRDLVDEVVSNINIDRGRRDGFVVETLRWELQSRPGAGPEPQAIVDGELGQDYDIFVGILGSRFGTPTSNAGSGTEDEFNQAYERYKTTGTPEILFYFQDLKSSLADIKAKELAKREDFQERIRNDGVTDWPFSTNEEFKTVFSRHLSSVISTILTSISIVEPNASTGLTTKSSSALRHFEQLDDNDEMGAEELLEQFQEKIAVFTGGLETTGDGVTRLGTNIDLATGEIEASKKLGAQVTTSQRKRITSAVSQHMDRYSRILVSTLPEMQDAIGDGLEAARRFVTLATEDNLVTSTEKEELKGSILVSQQSLQTVIIRLRSFTTELEKLPRMSTQLGRSKRRLIALNNDLIAFVESVSQQMQTLESDL